MKIQFPNIAIVGTGAMGRGIAQIAAQAGSQVFLLDANPGASDAARAALQEQWNKLVLAADKIHRAALELGGTVSSEHGIGLARAEYLPEQMGREAFSVMQSIKNALDPQGILNPGKMGL